MPSPWQVLALLFTPSFYILLSCGCLAQFRIIFNTLSTAAYHMQRGPLEAFAPSKHTAGGSVLCRGLNRDVTTTRRLPACCACAVLKTFVQYLESIFG